MRSFKKKNGKINYKEKQTTIIQNTLFEVKKLPNQLNGQ